MSSKRPLAPSPLNQLDHYLLTNKPEVWSARTHLVVYYGALFMAAFTLYAFVVPDDPRTRSDAGTWVLIMILIAALALTGWLILLLRFNVFKRWGPITAMGRLSTFLLYLVAVGTLFSFPLIMPAVESIRANKAYGDAEIRHDVNEINLVVCQLAYDSLSHDLHTDTILVVDRFPVQQQKTGDIDLVDSVEIIPPVHHYRRVDTASLPSAISEADSSVRLNDSLMVLFESPDYMFLAPYRKGGEEVPGLYSNYDLYRMAIQHHALPDRRSTMSRLVQLLKKYTIDFNSRDLFRQDETEQGYDKHSRIIARYNLYPVRFSLDNIAERKYRWDEDNAAIIFRCWFYCTLVVTLLIFVYRHTTRKAFFLSLLTITILGIVSLVISVSNTHALNKSVWITLFIALCLGLSQFTFTSRTRSMVPGLGINLFVLTVYFLPLSLLSWYHDFTVLHREDQQVPFDPYVLNYTLSIPYAELAGMLLLLLLLPTFIHRVYRKWYALPEE